MKVIFISKVVSISADLSLVTSALVEKFGKHEYRILAPKDGLRYKVEEIKELNIKLSRKPKDNENIPCFVFTKGETLSPICQNALLKTLEESIYSIIIISNNLDSLLPTIQSRCQSIYDEKNKSENESWDAVGDINIFNYEIISSLAKEKREAVIDKLSSELAQINPLLFQKVIHFQEAIDKVKANCKVESVLYELVWKNNKIN